jgi:hypothetical protein
VLQAGWTVSENVQCYDLSERYCESCKGAGGTKRKSGKNNVFAQLSKQAGGHRKAARRIE